MTPQNERRKMNFLSWVVPALLAVITGLIVAGGANIIDIMQTQAQDIAGLRKDFNSWQLSLESRVTRLEDAINARNEHPIIIRESAVKSSKPEPREKPRR